MTVVVAGTFVRGIWEELVKQVMPNGPLVDSCVWHYILMPNVVQPRHSIQCSPIVLVAKESNSLSLGSLRKKKKSVHKATWWPLLSPSLGNWSIENYPHISINVVNKLQDNEKLARSDHKWKAAKYNFQAWLNICENRYCTAWNWTQLICLLKLKGGQYNFPATIVL